MECDDTETSSEVRTSGVVIHRPTAVKWKQPRAVKKPIHVLAGASMAKSVPRIPQTGKVAVSIPGVIFFQKKEYSPEKSEIQFTGECVDMTERVVCVAQYR